MIKPHPKCKVCKALKSNRRLTDQIYNSRFYMKTQGLTLKSIAYEHRDKFNYDNLKNHVKKHQFISEEDFTQRHLGNIVKSAEKRMLKRKVESYDVFDGIMSKGIERLESDNMEIRASDLISAARWRKEFQLKETGQQLDYMNMVYHFASGENNESGAYDKRFIEGEKATDYDPAEESSADIKRRQKQSGAFYQRVTGDAPPSRPNQVS